MLGRGLCDCVDGSDGFGGTVNNGDSTNDDVDAGVLQAGNVLELDPRFFGVFRVGKRERGSNEVNLRRTY